MHSKSGLMSLVLAALFVFAIACPQSAWSSTPQDNSSTQNQDASANGSKPAPSEPSKQAPDLKPVSTDEGQLATVNNAKIPAMQGCTSLPWMAASKTTLLPDSETRKYL
jgi:cell division protein FtsN